MTTKAGHLLKNINLIQKLAWAYGIMFFFVASLAYIPGLANADGELFGVFHLDLYDDSLHFASGLWAIIAAWLSVRSSIFYFKTFGILYGMDGVIGLIFGQGYLDGGIFLYGVTPLNFGLKVAANTPHILIGGTAVVIGFVLSRRFANDA